MVSLAWRAQWSMFTYLGCEVTKNRLIPGGECDNECGIPGGGSVTMSVAFRGGGV